LSGEGARRVGGRFNPPGIAAVYTSESIALGVLEVLVYLDKVDPTACPGDPDDLIFLECAQAAAADYLITGNRKHFPDRWK
jgi:RES domain-containing protein